MKNHFILDFSTLFPFILANFLKLNFFELFFLLRIFKLRKVIKEIEDSVQSEDNNQYINELVKLFCFILYVANMSACCFHFISKLEINNGSNNSWLLKNNLMDSPWYEKYVNSFYFSIQIMATVGIYNTDSFKEKIFLSFFIIVMSGVFAFSINTIGAILNDMNKYHFDLKYNLIFYIY